ncbi:MAG: tetratricopeptide repeat protein [Myxococcaceae bacterium]
MRRSLPSPRLILALTCAMSLAAHAQRGRANAGELGTQVEEVAKQVKLAADNLVLVENQYTKRPETTDQMAREQRFSDGEINYLLGDYPTASVLFYDLVEDKDFHVSGRYADALFYLADSLYQQKNYLSARVYLKELLELRQGHYKEALARYLEIAGRLNEFAGIDSYIDQAKGLSGGVLPPELTYVYAKWMFKREDMSAEVRIPKAQNVFVQLEQQQSGPFRLQAAYFIGVGFVKLKQWDRAIERFGWIVSQPASQDPREKVVKELASLSLGRVLFEEGKFDEAIDKYNDIPRESDSFPDSLYETAWAFVRKGEFQRAKNATDILLLVAEDSVLAPEAKILQGTLLLKLQKYDDATETYNSVINTYAPVRDEIDALLTVNKDPVKYFDELLQRNDRNLDVTQLLPPVALKWASTRRDVADALQIIGDLEAGRRGVDDSNAIASRILKALDERGLEVFPVMQEGYTRADAVDSQITRAEEGLTRIEGFLVSGYLSDDQKKELESAKANVESLRDRVATLPTTEDEVKKRREKIRARVEEVDQAAFRLGIDIQAQYAQLAAIQKYVDDTRSTRKNTPEDEKAFLEKVNFERKALDGIVATLEETRKQLQDEKHNAENSIGGEEDLKREYEAALEKERHLYEQVRNNLPSDAAQVMLRADVVRADAESVRERVKQAKQILRDRVQKRAAKLRSTVQSEQALLDGYGKDVVGISSNAKELVGRIAFDSFKRVRQSFYDLVLKADVGVVDVAFTRKQDKTAQIQKLSSQKDRELKQLDDEFKEVLKDVD